MAELDRGITKEGRGIKAKRDPNTPAERVLKGRGVEGKRVLTDRGIKALKLPPKGEIDDHMDAVVPGFGVRVFSSGAKTFMLAARFPNKPKVRTRRALGAYGEISLEKARERAKHWLELIHRGVDPKEELERQRQAEEDKRQAELLKRGTTFKGVVDDFLTEVVLGDDPGQPLQRTAKNTKRDFEKEFAIWNDRPISSITRPDVKELLASIKKRGKYRANNVQGHLHRFFAWAVAEDKYGITTSPVVGIKRPPNLKSRDRILNDEEIKAFWKAAETLGEPFTPLLHMLLLTGLRRSEASEAVWPEIKLKARQWVIPEERMKGKVGKAKAHMVPLTDLMIAILEALPEHTEGNFVFSTTGGKRPVNGFSKIKRKLDAAMEIELGHKLEKPWVLHDLRRTMRTNLSKLKVPPLDAEVTIAHALPTIMGTYNLFDYADEKREALTKWSAHVQALVPPPPDADNVV